MSEERSGRREEGRRGSPGIVGRLLTAALKGLAFAVMLAVPLLGTWSASSLAVYWNGPLAMAIGAGLLAFPVLPLAWEGLAAWRRRRAERASKKPPPPRILTFGDRMILRTLTLDGAFLAVFLVGWPQQIFTALSTRGDWFLEDVEGADRARELVLRAADGMEWLYELAHENPYARDDDDAEHDDTDETPVAGGAIGGDAGVGAGSGSESDADAGSGSDADAGSGSDTGSDTDAGSGSDTDNGSDTDTDTDTGSGPWRAWPFPETVHPAVAAIPASEEESLAAVAAYLRAEVQDPFERAKAVHDYVATRVAYDVPALTGRRPPQDAETVFRTRQAVCEGYARLFDALGDRAGLEVRYVVGDARSPGDPANGEPHAWNAIRLEGGWYLVDATWDAGGVRDGSFAFRYSSMYFLTSPEVFGVNHFPDDRVWQLRDRPLTRGEFHRQPVLQPRFHADGFRLESPDRSQVEVTGDAFEAHIASEGRAFLTADLRSQGQMGGPEDCEITGDRALSIRCPVRSPGTYSVMLFTGAERYGTYWSVGSIQVVRR